MAKSKLLLLLLPLLMSCGTSKPVTVVDVQKDSVTVIVRDSVVIRDTIVYVEVPVEVKEVVKASTDTSRLETSLAVSEAWLSEGHLNHTLKNKETAIEKSVTIPEHHKVEEIERIIYKEIVNEVEVEKELTKWQSFRMTLGTIALISFLIWLCIVFMRKSL